MILRGGVRQAGSKTAAGDANGFATLALRIQVATMGTREAQYTLLVLLTAAGVCVIKPINGKIPQKGILGVGSAYSDEEAG